MLVSRISRPDWKSRLFSSIHRRNLLYNQCWEDPALDRQALDFQADDRVLLITSAGCNALDYLLAGAGEVTAVDVNPIQNAVLHLKAAGIRGLDYDSFFELFGNGSSPYASELYHDQMRPYLPEPFQAFWDDYIQVFEGTGWRGSFYYRGSSGTIARIATTGIQLDPWLRAGLDQIAKVPTLEDQKAVYEDIIRDRLWRPQMKLLLSRWITMAAVGVPEPQRNQVIRAHGSVLAAVRHAVESVLTRLSFRDNYFWQVYLQGHYTKESCPEYLKEDNFRRLKDGLVDRLHIKTGTLTDYLNNAEPGISKFSLLDHMDWMAWHDPAGLTDEWNALLKAARPGGRVIFRSAGLDADFLSNLPVQHDGRTADLGKVLSYDQEKAARLHKLDRVHTYGSFHIADLPAA